MADGLDCWDTYRLRCITSSAPRDPTDFAEIHGAELQDRLGVVEEYLVDHEEFSRRLCDAQRAAHADVLRRFCADEGEERRFVDEDATDLPHRLFVSVSFTAAQGLLFRREAAQRACLWSDFLVSFSELLWIHEELRRADLAWAALDSLALKACIVGRYGVREGQLARTTIPGYTVDTTCPLTAAAAARAAAVQALEKEEREQRKELVQAQQQFVVLALLAVASSEKRRYFAATSSARDNAALRAVLSVAKARTARQVLETSATRIQSLFRGYRVRAVHATS